MNVSREICGRLVVPSTGTTISVDPNYDYTIVHTGRTSANAFVSDAIACGFNDADADGGLGLNKLILNPGDAIGLPVGVGKINVKSLSTGNPVIQIIRGNVAEYSK